jgi:hypothetical protein
MSFLRKIYLFYLLILLISCSICENTIIAEKVSPRKDFLVYLFDRDCGATTSKSAHISLKKRNSKLKNSEKGNIFIADNIEKIEVDWVNTKSIEISVNSDCRIFLQEEKYNDIEINVIYY